MKNLELEKDFIYDGREKSEDMRFIDKVVKGDMEEEEEREFTEEDMKRMEKVKKEDEEYIKNELRRKRRKELSKEEFAIAEELDNLEIDYEEEYREWEPELDEIFESVSRPREDDKSEFDEKTKEEILK